MDVTSSHPPIQRKFPRFVLFGCDIETNDFKPRLLSELASATYNSFGSFSLFSNIQGQIRHLCPSDRVAIWKRVLDVIREDKDEKYQELHKGEPFYWLAHASYLTRDYEGALFWMDCALSEDYRRWQSRWREMPAGLFLLVDESRADQAAQAEVQRLKKEFDRVTATVNIAFGLAFSVDEYRNRLAYRAMEQAPSLRSVVTAFVSFILEHADRRADLALVPATSPTVHGTAEPFMLHLFKGCVLLESLLKLSGDVPSGTPMLNGLLSHRPIYSALGASGPILGFSSVATLDEFFQVLRRHRADQSQSPILDVRATWGLRNLIGHNLALPRRPTIAEYDEMFTLVFAAVSRVILRLYPRT